MWYLYMGIFTGVFISINFWMKDGKPDFLISILFGLSWPVMLPLFISKSPHRGEFN